MKCEGLRETPEFIEQQIERARRTLIQDIQLLEKETMAAMTIAKEDIKKDLKKAVRLLDPRPYVLSHPWISLECAVAIGILLDRWVFPATLYPGILFASMLFMSG